MAKQRATVGGWLANQLWNTSLPWLVVIFFAGAGFYFVTNSTLATHTKDLADLKTTLSESKKDDATERTKVREAFLADSKSTALGIAELNKQTAVQGVQLAAIATALAKLSDKLDGVRR